MRFSAWPIFSVILFFSSPVAFPAPLPSKSQTISVTSQQAGSTPFISFLSLFSTQPISAIKNIRFTITPKPGSVTRPISVAYSKSYLESRGYINPPSPKITLPVFGLYANYSNPVVVTIFFNDGSSQQKNVVIATGAFSDPCGYNNPIVIQARSSSRSLSYDYMLLKNNCGTFSPTILDTDGEIRWVGTAGVAGLPSTVFQNAVYLASENQLYRIEFDGTVSVVASYPNILFLHNIDYGKIGMILDENIPGQIEDVNVEVDAHGNVLETWNLATIIRDAMIAGGDDPSMFVYPPPADWFHNNAVAYRQSDDSLAVSSRENFVISIDYETGAIKWILGDPTKHWHEFNSLTQFALTLAPNSLPPIGQHAVSFTGDDRLLLFDDGKSSLVQMPPGADRTYSVPRKYQINLETGVATEEWNYANGQSSFLYCAFCSSVYEDLPLNYLIDYSDISNLGGGLFMELLGLSASGEKVFDYRYRDTGCNQAWNSIPIHLEHSQFTTIVPLNAVSRKVHGAAGTFDFPLSLSGSPGIECRSGDRTGLQYQVVVTFPTSVTIASATVTPGAGGTAAVMGVPAVSGNQVTVNLTNVSDAQTITLSLVALNDGSSMTDTVSVPMTVLVGDTSGDGFVNASDVARTKEQSGQPVTASNYREDVTADGEIDSADVALVKSLSGTGIPRP